MHVTDSATYRIGSTLNSILKGLLFRLDTNLTNFRIRCIIFKRHQISGDRFCGRVKANDADYEMKQINFSLLIRKYIISLFICLFIQSREAIVSL